MGAYHFGSYSHITGNLPPLAAGYQDELWASEQCREAITTLERALLAPPLQLTREANRAARLVGKVREKVLEWGEQGNTREDKQHWKKVLGRLDQAQALIDAAAHPTSAIRRKPVEQARDTLRSILVEGLF